MIHINPTTKPFIDRNFKSFVKYLADSGIFEKQLDAWAYAVAFAMQNQLSAKPRIFEGEMPQFQFLDKEVLNCLVTALVTIKPDLKTEEEIVTELSRLASAGIAVIQEQIGEHGRNSAYEFLLKQI